jgi:predicted HTH transcriptional regulator
MPVQLDRIIHDKKHFAELEDGDVEMFLRERKFGSEHLNIEFKEAFPQKGKNKYDIKTICKYIVGFSNEEGGLVAYGVADNIKDRNVTFPDYISGLNEHPSAEDLSQWVTDRIHPLIASPAIRFFSVASRKVAVLKIPAGVNKPYCYYDPESHSVTYFKKTSAGIRELTPDEIREFHRTQILTRTH